MAELSCSQGLGPTAEGLTGAGWGPKEGLCPRRGLANHVVGKRLRRECGRDRSPGVGPLARGRLGGKGNSEPG